MTNKTNTPAMDTLAAHGVVMTDELAAAAAVLAKVTSREDHEAQKAQKAAIQLRQAKDARKLIAAADADAAKTLAKIAERYYCAGSLVAASTLSDRGFAILAEHGSKEAFDATGKAQPLRLSSYRRARVIFAACDAVGTDVGEAVATYLADIAEQGAAAVGITQFADYCAAGFTLPAAKVAAADDDVAEQDHETILMRQARRIARAVAKDYSLSTVAEFDRVLDALAELRLAVVKAEQAADEAAAAA